jgi:hypothetical protein
MLRVVRLEIQPESGKTRIVDATPEAIESALREMDTLQFIICRDDGGRYMQDDGKVLEYGEYIEVQSPRLSRASTGTVRLHGSRPAFLSFLQGTDEWRELYEWKDVSHELPTVWEQRLRWVPAVAFILFVLWVVWLWWTTSG